MFGTPASWISGGCKVISNSQKLRRIASAVPCAIVDRGEVPLVADTPPGPPKKHEIRPF